MRRILLTLAVFYSTLLYGQVNDDFSVKESVQKKLQGKAVYKTPLPKPLVPGCWASEIRTYYLLPNQILMPDRRKIYIDQFAEKKFTIPKMSILMQNPAFCKVTLIPYENANSFIDFRK